MLKKNLRKLVTATILIIATLFLFVPTQQANPVLREKYYTVILAPCGFGWYGKPPDGTVMGEWYVDCDGNWDGWGWHPGDSCTDTEITLGQQCYQ